MELLQKLGIRQPIFVAPMAGVSTPELAAAVSNAGGLGALGLGSSDAKTACAAIEKTQALTSKPFQVNFFCHQPEAYDAKKSEQWLQYLSEQFTEFDTTTPKTLNKIYQSFLEDDDLLKVVLETKPKVISFHFGIPRKEQIEQLKNASILTMVTVTQLSEALEAQRAGIDVLIVQGVEAGGHRGMFNPRCDSAMSTLDLLLLLTQYVDLPLVAAGGIMTGMDIKLYLELGASAAQLGTAFVQCKESAANAAYREALFEQPMTQITDSISGRPARGLFNAWHQYVDLPERPEHAGYPYTYDAGKQLHAAANKQDEQGYAAFWAGSNVVNIRRLDADELMKTLVTELA